MTALTAITGLTAADLGAIAITYGPIFVFLGACAAVWYRFRRLERQAAYRQEDTAMIFLCLRGVMEGLIENGMNGPVKDALRTLNTYTDNKAAGLTGKGNHSAA
jgi:hypothetical protein